MRGPGRLLHALRHLLTALAVGTALAGPALAEGRHDPFLSCTFTDGRSVTLAENGSGTDWIEDAVTTPARSYADRRQPGDSLVTVTAWLAGGMQRLDIYAPLAPAEGAGPHPAPLSALLSRSLTSGARIEVSTVSGNCAESHG